NYYLYKIFLIHLAVYVLISNGSAQSVIVSGFIIDRETGEYLIGATVADTDSFEGGITNKFGFYSIVIKQSRSITLRYSYVGYTPVCVHFSPQIDTTLNIQLVAGANIDEIQITSEKGRRIEERADIGKVMIPISQIKMIPNIMGEPDILKAYQLMPGIQSGSEGTNGLFVRGGTPDQNLYLFDDVPLYNVSHLGGMFSTFNASIIKSIDFYKGGFPARYGGRTSSVIDIRSKDGNLHQYKGEIGINLFLSKFFLEGPLIKNKASFAISARRSNLDIYTLLFAKLSSRSENAGYFFRDLNLKANYILSDKDRLFISAYHGRDKYYYKQKKVLSLFVNEEHVYKSNLSWGNSSSSIRWQHVFGNKIFNNLTFAFTKYNYLNHNLYKKKDNNTGMTLTDEYQFLSGVADIILKSDLEIPLKQNRIRIGGKYSKHSYIPSSISYSQVLGFENGDSVMNSPEQDTKLNADEFSAYLEYIWKSGNKLSGNFG
ncbi:hypothetical protein LCGC14_2536680, partial [marine sediment metagenome]